jgi:SAM-dependent methyltransferase
MYLNPRPSKISFRKIFATLITQSEPFSTVLDCASAGAKNIGLFQGKEYHGVDINQELIETARQKYGSQSTAFFYHDDLLNFTSTVKDRMFDLVVCTHTLAALAENSKSRALNNLAERVRPGGSFILQCSSRELAYTKALEGMFSKITYYPYRGALSRAYEALLGKIYQTDAIGSLGSVGRVRLYKYSRHAVLLAALPLSALDRFFNTDTVVVFFTRRK